MISAPTNLAAMLSPPPRQRTWGIRMDGIGPVLEDLVKQHVATVPTSRVYTMVEIGSAGCVSLRSFRDIIAEARSAAPWRVVGFDLTPDKAWSLDMEEVKRSFSNLPWQVWQDDIAARVLGATGMSLVLLNGPRAYLAAPPETPGFPHQIDLAFIDGCHGKCSGEDFLAIEQKMAPGGVVVFHDYGEAETGTDLQPHCREFINVRSYVHRLGLATPTPSGTTRKGWLWLGEIKGSRHWGGEGNSCAVVRRTDEPLAHQPELSIDHPSAT